MFPRFKALDKVGSVSTYRRVTKLSIRKPYEPYPIIGFMAQTLRGNRSDNMAWTLEMTRAAGWRTWRTYIPGAVKGWYICDPK